MEKKHWTIVSTGSWYRREKLLRVFAITDNYIFHIIPTLSKHEDTEISVVDFLSFSFHLDLHFRQVESRSSELWESIMPCLFSISLLSHWWSWLMRYIHLSTTGCIVIACPVMLTPCDQLDSRWTVGLRQLFRRILLSAMWDDVHAFSCPGWWHLPIVS